MMRHIVMMAKDEFMVEVFSSAEMIVADGGWQRVIALQLEGGRLTSRDLGRYASSAVEAAMKMGRGIKIFRSQL